MLETVTLVVTEPSAEAQRIGLYALAAIVGVLVCGLIAVARDLRMEAASRP